MTISSSEAQLELALLNVKALDLDRLDVFTLFINADIPQEIVFRLEELWDKTKIVGEKIIHIGRIIILEIIRFIEKNPNLAIGVALGAAVGSIVSLIPFLGPALAPLTIALGAAFGGVMGSRLDRAQKPGHLVEMISQEAIIIARRFFELLANIFNALKDDLTSNAKD